MGFAAPVPDVKLNVPVPGLFAPCDYGLFIPRLKLPPPAGAGPVPVDGACLFYMANRFTG